MAELKEYMINETSEFSSMENNPMIYTLVIPKLLHSNDVDAVKKDEVIKNVVDVTEKFIKTLNKDTIKFLKNQCSPAAVMEMFKLSKNYRNTFDDYLVLFHDVICNEEKNFMKCLELDKKLAELYSSPEYQAYRNTL
jgi:hypothetical protein